jgi:hypothetical protein
MTDCKFDARLAETGRNVKELQLGSVLIDYGISRCGSEAPSRRGKPEHQFGDFSGRLPQWGLGSYRIGADSAAPAARWGDGCN